jgi:hypothetical protein
MSTQDDIRFLAQQVVALTAKVEAMKDVPKEDTRTEKQITDDADKEARRVAHEARTEKYKEDNSREAQRKRTAPVGRRDDPVVPPARTTLMGPPQGMKPRPVVQQPQVQPITPATVNHPWKVRQANDALGKPIPYAVEVIGGNIFTQGYFNPAGGFPVESLAAMTIGNGQTVVVSINRESTSRALTSAAIEPQNPVSESTNTTQYVALATVSLSATGIVTNVLQKQFEDLCIDELLTVENGAFKLAPVRLAGQNTYDLPPP